ncbi:nickel pincer cofactor biosynthesis protein LarC [Methanopyrus sp. KOL6]|uniref:nickel pincer cofactor biosynthesis protein LarC n=1 Tax=Methanopyrus sp. KOL6 TaxID=1937004 RepID=UPI000B4AF511|nr:nickel pincer cofactor biosynthesis protein LarC [Methanopyrus sp. KOL6]
MILTLDPQVAGASGDMVLGALIAVGADPNRLEEVVHEVSSLGHEVDVHVHEIRKRGVRAVRVEVDAEGDLRDPDELRESVKTVAENVLEDRWRELPELALKYLLRAEERVHGDLYHLHELGSSDTVVDLVGTAALLEDLNPKASEVLPPNVGSGTVEAEHGRLPVPAPAVVEVLSGWDVGIVWEGEGELLTPTGAALLRTIDELLPDPSPPYMVKRQGFGAGARDLPDRPNVLRALICEPGGSDEHVRIVETSVDDVDGEAVGELIEAVLQLEGVRDVEILHGFGKKGRPRFVIRVVTEDRPGIEREVFRELFRWTGTLGARVYRCTRVTADRRVVDVDGIRVKVSRFEDVHHAKPEWEDVRREVDRESAPLTRARLVWGLRKRYDGNDENGVGE